MKALLKKKSKEDILKTPNIVIASGSENNKNWSRPDKKDERQGYSPRLREKNGVDPAVYRGIGKTYTQYKSPLGWLRNITIYRV